jgi:hypothetical protein
LAVFLHAPPRGTEPNPHAPGDAMNLTTIIIILVVLLLLGGGWGYSRRGRM